MDFESRHIIEALRSGISSRVVGRTFSSARPRILAGIDAALAQVAETGKSEGMILSGKYGEGKTHLLNTVFSMAHDRNMVVSLVSLSKETPFDKLPLVYAKVIQGTYLPGRVQPGFSQVFESMALDSPVAASMLETALTSLETNRLYYVLKTCLGTEDVEERFRLLADMEGDFIASGTLKQMYKRVFSQRAKENASFVKTRHAFDYFAFMSELFQRLGYSGWVILFDEAELLGRLGKKARLNAYANMARFLFPERDAPLRATYSMFAFNASFVSDVIDNKREHENLEASGLEPEKKRAVSQVLGAISAAPQLAPLTHDEIMEILTKIQELHGKAYDWAPDVDLNKVFSMTEKRGYLLRTRIRAAVEMLDQLYQYGAVGEIRIGELGKVAYEEDAVSLDGILVEEMEMGGGE